MSKVSRVAICKSDKLGWEQLLFHVNWQLQGAEAKYNMEKLRGNTKLGGRWEAE